MRGRPVLLCVLLLTSLVPVVPAPSSSPDDYTGEVIVGEETWTGVINRTTGILVPAGATLRIHNATVLWQTQLGTTFGLVVEAGGTLIVRDTVMMNGQPWRSQAERTARYWTFEVRGVIDIERTIISHNADVTFERDGVKGSRIKDTQFVWMSRGLHLLRTNMDADDGWDLVLDNVTIRDVPVVTGGGTTEIGGGIGILNGNVFMRDVTVERVRATGLFVDSSAVARETGAFGNRVHAERLVIISGSPEGYDSEGAFMDISNIGEFECESCSFVSAEWSYMKFNIGGRSVLRNSTIVNGWTSFNLNEGESVLFDNVRNIGRASYIIYQYGNDGGGEFRNVSFDAADGARGAYLPGNTPVSMRGIYWGDPSGPRDDEPDDASTPLTNPGSGRSLLGPIDYSGWLTAPPARGGDIVVDIDSLPTPVLPGESVTLGYSVTSRRDTPIDLELRALGPVAPAAPLPRIHLPAHGTVTGTLVATASPLVEPGADLHVALLAWAPGAHGIDAAASVAGYPKPTLALDTPAPQSLLTGDVAVAGRVIEPSRTLPAPAATTGGASSGLSSLDSDGDRIDDRLSMMPGPVLVHVMHDGASSDSISDAVEALGGAVIRRYSLVPDVYALLDSAQLGTLAQTDGVRGIWWDEPLRSELAVGVRAARARSSAEGVVTGGNAPDIAYPGVWSGDPRAGHSGPTGRGVLVAVIDSGVDPTHLSLDDFDDDAATHDPKIADHISTFAILAAGSTKLAMSSVITPGTHGTGVAGTVAGTGQGFIGDPRAPIHQSTPEDPWLHAGAAPGARILDIDAFEEVKPQPMTVLGAGVAPSAGFGLAMEGFEAVANWNRQHPDDRVRVVQISLSIGVGSPSHPLNIAADALADTDVLVVVAAGNNDDGVVVPASADKVLAVGATETQGTVNRADDYKARYSDTANAEQRAAGMTKPELMAPSYVRMPAMGTVDGYDAEEKRGTSFAAPIVSGIAALMIEANPGLHAAQLKEILIRSSEPRGGAYGAGYTDVNLDFRDDLPDGGWDPKWAFGYVDAEEAVRLARATQPRTPPTPPILALHAHADGSFDEAEPALSVPLAGSATFSFVAPRATTMGDGDLTTTDDVLLVVASPTADPEASVHNLTASLFVDNVLVARTYHSDNTIRTTQGGDTRIPLVLGSVIGLTESGPDAGIRQTLQTLAVRDARGDVRLPEGGALRLDIALKHGDAAGVIMTGPGATRLTAPVAADTLPNLGAPSAVSGLRATWDANEVRLRWGPAADDRGIGAYEVFRDGALVATLGGRVNAFDDTDVSAGASHAYTVRARDLHGLLGPISAPQHVVLPRGSGRDVIVEAAGTSLRATDATGDGSFNAWTATLAAPDLGRHLLRATLFLDGETVDVRESVFSAVPPANLPPVVTLPDAIPMLRGALVVPVVASDPDGAGDIARIESRIDGSAWRPVSGGTVTLDAASLAPGAHTLEARVFDASGVVASDALAFESRPWLVTIDAPRVLRDGEPVALRVFVEGDGVAGATPAFRASGVSTHTAPLVAAADGSFTAELPPMPSGSLRLDILQDDQLLHATTFVVDKPPTAAILGPASATRLDAITLDDASTDDSGVAHRVWTLPNGSTSTAPRVVIEPRALAVGEHVVTLVAHNANGLTSTAAHTLVVRNIAPQPTASSFRVLGVPATHAYVGEVVSVNINVTDAEGDAVAFQRGLLVDNATVPVAAPGGLVSFRPLTATPAGVDIVAHDGYDATTLKRTLPVRPNTLPVARLSAPTLVDAGSTVLLDARNSSDADRAYLEHAMTIDGLGTFPTSSRTLRVGMGTYDIEHVVRDSSGATNATRLTIVADDWLAAKDVWIQAPSTNRQGFLDLRVSWWDGAVAPLANVTVEVRHAAYPGIARTYTAQTADDGTALLALGYDLGVVNVPGPHIVRITARHASLPDAPVQDEEVVVVERMFLV